MVLRTRTDEIRWHEHIKIPLIAAKVDYQREYMRRYRADKAVRPIKVLRGPVRPNTGCVRPIGDGIAPKVQHFNPMMIGYEPLPE